jgi:sRNA-binding regulator protein Hfq
MRKLWTIIIAGFVLSLSATFASSDESARSFPKDTTQYARPAVPNDVGAQPPGTAAAAGAVSLVRIVDTVVNNTDPNLKNNDTFNDGETSIAVNPANPNEIVISAFSGSWGANAPIWHSTDSGQTWTKRFTIPAPPGVGGVAGCPCDQVFDYGRNNVLYGAFLTGGPENIYTGSTTNPASAAAWSWWLVGGVAQSSNSVATSIGNADQPWLLRNNGIGSGGNEDVYAAYDDFGTNPVNTRVSVSVNKVPPQFPVGSDKLTGSAAGAINPGHRMAQDPRTGWIYSLHQNCITNCATLAANPKTIQYFLNRSVDEGMTWALNGSANGIVVATADSTQPQPKFGTVNALLGGVLHAAVDPTTSDLYYVYGNRDASGNNRLAIRRVFDNGSGGVTIGAETFVVSGTVQAALPSVAVNGQGMVGVFYYTFNGIVGGFPQFSTWLAVSTDQGASFNTQLLATFLSPATDNADPRQRVFGDYVQTKAVGDCFYGSFTGNGAAFGRSTANNDPVFFQACAPPLPPVVASISPNTGPADGGTGVTITGTRLTGTTSVTFGGSLAIGVSVVNDTTVTANTPAHAAGTVDVTVISDHGLGTKLGAFTYFGVSATCTLASQFGDFNGDSRSDLLLRRSSDGMLVQYLLNGFQFTSVQLLGVVGLEWTLAAVADFNGDGMADMLFRRNSDGMLSLYLLNGSQVLAAQLLGIVGLEWDLVGTADFNGDGRADMVFRRKSDGMLSLYLINGFQILQAELLGAVGVDWRVRAVADFNGDGRADILFRRDSDGMMSLYLFSGFQLLGAQLLGAVGTDWNLLGARDFNGDGKADILFRRSSDGVLSLYLMNGFQILQAQSLGAVGLDWNLLGLGDFNGDGRSDMLFRRTSDGQLAMYLMNGFQIIGAQVIGTIGNEWTACYGQPPLSVASRVK